MHTNDESSAEGSHSSAPVKPQNRVLTKPEQIEALAQALSKEDLIAYDTEFIRETTFHPQLEILQIATRSEAWIVDIQAFRKLSVPMDAALKPLLDVFTNPGILKIVHAAVGDQEAVYTNLGVIPTPLFDTAVGAALSGLGESIGLGNLLKAVLGVKLRKGHARTHWGIRPLPDQLIEYALADVEHLIQLTEKLFAKLEKLGRKQWALDECRKFTEARFIDPGPQEIAAKLTKTGKVDQKGYPILIELLKWREGRVRELNRPRKWVAEDSILVDLANVRPRNMDHLSAFRGINKNELKVSGDEILAAIHKGHAVPASQAPLPPRAETPVGEEVRVVELLKCFLGMRADELSVAPNLLVHSQAIIRLIRCHPCTRETWVKERIMSASVAELIGGDLESFLQGEISLTVTNHKVHYVKG